MSTSEIWKSAGLLVRMHGQQAPKVAEAWAQDCASRGDREKAAEWMQIMHAAEDLMRPKPKAGELVQ